LNGVSNVTVTFDLWSDGVGRHFVGVVGHYFDSNLVLQSNALCLLELTAAVDDGASIATAIRARLLDLYGVDFLHKVAHSVVDNGGNCVSAARILTPGSARRCLQHNIQLLFKWFTASNRPIATALAICNYIARTSKLR